MVLNQSITRLDATPRNDDRSQTCLFCLAKSEDMAVYSVGLGRVGICIDCSRKAQAVLEKHQVEPV